MSDSLYDRLSAIDNSFLVFEDASPSVAMHVASTQIHEAAPLRKQDGSIVRIRCGNSGSSKASSPIR